MLIVVERRVTVEPHHWVSVVVALTTVIITGIGLGLRLAWNGSKMISDLEGQIKHNEANRRMVQQTVEQRLTENHADLTRIAAKQEVSDRTLVGIEIRLAEQQRLLEKIDRALVDERHERRNA